MKYCAREADKGRRLQGALRALVDDCREIQPQMIAHARACLNDPQGKLFNERLAALLPSGTDPGTGQVLEREFLAGLRYHESCGKVGREALRSALSDAIARRRDSQFRAMKGHWAKNAGTGAASAINAADRVLQDLPVSQLADRILTGEIDPEQLQGSRAAVDLDEDLRGGDAGEHG